MIRGGRVIRYGVNQMRYAKNKSYFYCSLHAEAALIRKCKPSEIRGAKILVYRFNNTTADDARDPKCSTPCHLCQHELKKAGISRITCMDLDGKIITMKRSDLVSLQDDPSIITMHFLNKYGDDYHGKFYSDHYLEKSCV